jgi:hypothetical protein
MASIVLHISHQTAHDIALVAIGVMAGYVGCLLVMVACLLVDEPTRNCHPRPERDIGDIHQSTLRRMWGAVLPRERDEQ